MDRSLTCRKVFYYIHTCRVITRTSECYHVSDKLAQDMNRIGYGHAALFRCILPRLCVGIAGSLPNSASYSYVISVHQFTTSTVSFSHCSIVVWSAEMICTSLIMFLALKSNKVAQYCKADCHLRLETSCWRY